MLRQISGSRLKIFAVVAAACVIATSISAVALWDSWRLAALARNLGVHEDPFSVGLLAALIPIYFVGIELWLPIRPHRKSSGSARREPMSDSQKHWNAIRIVALMCILATEFVVQSLPAHHAAAATRTDAR